MPTHESTARSHPDIDAPDRRRLPPLLRRAWFSLNQAFRRRIHHLEITPDQFTILRWLTESAHGGITQKQIADLMASDPNTVASLLQRMEGAGLVDRQPDPDDRRANRVRLLPKGKRIYSHARKIAVDLQAEVLENLPERRREAFLADLETLADACRDKLDHI